MKIAREASLQVDNRVTFSTGLLIFVGLMLFNDKV